MTSRKFLDPNSLEPGLELNEIERRLNEAELDVELLLRLFSPTSADIREALVDLWRLSSEYISVQTGDYTSKGTFKHEIIISDETGTGTQTFTLHQFPSEGQMVTCKKRGNKTMSIATEGSETIDGSSSDTVTDSTTYMAAVDSSTDTMTVNYIIVASV